MGDGNGNGNGFSLKGGLYPLLLALMLGGAAGGSGGFALRGDGYGEDRRFINEKLQALGARQEELLKEIGSLRSGQARLEGEVVRLRDWVRRKKDEQHEQYE